MRCVAVPGTTLLYIPARRAVTGMCLAVVATPTVSVSVSPWTDLIKPASVIELVRSVRKLLCRPLRVSGGRVQILRTEKEDAAHTILITLYFNRVLARR